MVGIGSCLSPRQGAAIAGIVDIVGSTFAIIYTHYHLSFDSQAAESMGLSALYKYESLNGSHRNASYMNEFIQLSFNKTATRRIFIPPAACGLFVGTLLLITGLLNKHWLTIVSCIATSILIGGLIPFSIALLVMEVKWPVLVPFLLYTLLHAFFLYILLEMAESLVRPTKEQKPFKRIVVEDFDQGIIMSTETFPSVVPVIVISKPRLPTPAPDDKY